MANGDDGLTDGRIYGFFPQIFPTTQHFLICGIHFNLCLTLIRR
jgi:hypothetical protein